VRGKTRTRPLEKVRKANGGFWKKKKGKKREGEKVEAPSQKYSFCYRGKAGKKGVYQSFLGKE